jgi:hypothetical protein
VATGEPLSTSIASGFTFLSSGVTWVTGQPLLLAVICISIAGAIAFKVKSLF